MPEETDQTHRIDEEAPLDAGASGDEALRGGGLLRVLLLVLPAILVPATAGAYVAFNQYSSLARTAVYFGIDFGLVEEEEEESIQYGEFLVLSDIIVNPAGSHGKRFLLLSLGLESQQPAALEEVTTKDIVVRDVVLKVMGERTVEQLSSIEHRDDIKEELRGALNDVLEQGGIDRLYFTQFVLQ